MPVTPPFKGARPHGHTEIKLGYILLAAFIGIPIAEIAVFIYVGEEIGLWPTLGIVVVTAIAGTGLLRRQGLATLFKVQEEMEAGRVPLREMFDGACLFLPPVRSMVMAVLAAVFANRSTIHVHTTGGYDGESNPDGTGWDRQGGDGPVIDGEYTDVSPNAEPDQEATNPDTIVRRIE
jgi:UPF0716 protein FxsA